jgi:hypothetical protein
VTVGFGVGVTLGFGVWVGSGAVVCEGSGDDDVDSDGAGDDVDTSIGGITGSSPLSPMRVTAKPIPAIRAIATRMSGTIGGLRVALPETGAAVGRPVGSVDGNGEALSLSVGAAGDADRRSVGAAGEGESRSVGSDEPVSRRSVAASARFEPSLGVTGRGRVRGRGSSGTWSKRSVGVSSLMPTAYAVERPGMPAIGVAFVRKLS